MPYHVLGEAHRRITAATDEGSPYHKASYKGMPGLIAKIARSTMRLGRSEEHTSELQSLMRISYAVFCLKKKKRCNIYYNEHCRIHIYTISNCNYISMTCLTCTTINTSTNL